MSCADLPRDGDGDCDVSFDYRYFVMGGAQIQIVVEINGIAGSTATHVTEDSARRTVPLAVACGDSTLEFRVSTVALPFLANGHVFPDNVAGEARDRGTLRALYR